MGRPAFIAICERWECVWAASALRGCSNRRGLRGVSRRKWLPTTIRAGSARPAPDLVQRRFVATGPNQLWVADISVPQQAA
jgi:transposase InsO family protein